MEEKDDNAGHDETPEGKWARDATHGMMPAEGKSPGSWDGERTHDAGHAWNDCRGQREQPSTVRAGSKRMVRFQV